jgi:hypothetical protein
MGLLYLLPFYILFGKISKAACIYINVKSPPTQDFMKIPPVEAEQYDTDEQT